MRMLGRRADLREVVADAKENGRAVRVVVGGMDKQSVLSAFVAGLDLPARFGTSLDALADGVRDLEDPDGLPIELIWDGVAALRSSDKDTYVAVRELLREVDEHRPDLRVTIVDR